MVESRVLVIAVTRENRKWERERVFKDLLSFILCVYVSACMHARVPHVCLVPVKAKQGMSDLLELELHTVIRTCWCNHSLDESTP